jgi:hypothetical protein
MSCRGRDPQATSHKKERARQQSNGCSPELHGTDSKGITHHDASIGNVCPLLLLASFRHRVRAGPAIIVQYGLRRDRFVAWRDDDDDKQGARAPSNSGSFAAQEEERTDQPCRLHRTALSLVVANTFKRNAPCVLPRTFWKGRRRYDLPSFITHHTSERHCIISAPPFVVPTALNIHTRRSYRSS